MRCSLQSIHTTLSVAFGTELKRVMKNCEKHKTNFFLCGVECVPIPTSQRKIRGRKNSNKFYLNRYLLQVD